MPFVHAQLYLVTLFPAFGLGLLLAWGFGTGLVSRVVPVVICLGVTWLLVSEWLKHVDATRPVAWHRAVLRSELRAPRPVLAAQAVATTTSTEHLLEVPPVPAPRTEPWSGVLARSEEHTSELQSRQYLVCRLLLEKKKKS